MHGHISHFAINSDDVAATRRFYEGLFGWTFTEAYPGFWRTTDAGAAIGAPGTADVHARRRLRGHVRGRRRRGRGRLRRAPRRPDPDASGGDPRRGGAGLRRRSERERRGGDALLLTQRWSTPRW